MAARSNRKEAAREKHARWPILVILLAALAARLLGIGYGLPLSHDPAEEKNVEQALRHNLLFRSEKLVPDDTERSPLTSYIVAAEYGGAFGIGNIFGRVSSLMEWRYLFLTRPGFFIGLARLSSVVFGLLAVYLLYGLCARALDWGVGLIAAVFLALSPAAAHFSRLAVGDAIAMFFLLAGVWQLVELAIDKRFITTIYAALLFGLSAGVAYEYAPLTIVLVAAYLMIIPGEYKTSATALGALLVAAAWVVGVVAPSAGAIITAPRSSLPALAKGAVSAFGAWGISDGALVLSRLKELVSIDVFGDAAGWAIAVAGILGLLWGLFYSRSSRRVYVILIVFLLVCAVVYFPLEPDNFRRWVFLMTPALSVGAAVIIYRLFWRKRMSASLGVTLMALAAALVAAQGAAQIGVWGLRRTANDTRNIFARWAVKELPSGARVVTTQQARFLRDNKYIERQRSTWEPWRQRLIQTWNGRAFSAFTVSADDPTRRLPPLDEFDYLAVDSRSESQLRRIAQPSPAPWWFGGADKSQRDRAVEILAMIDTARGKGTAAKVIPQPPRGLAGYGPKIEVYRLRRQVEGE
ncbi:MAG: glycosyltransferase family 39 protein [Planctomycetota bacterium]|jgi:4-amino-4-deoxy-L-arabinose transferase-like glycosyltransferase